MPESGRPGLAIALVGYGRMGREIHRLAPGRGHNVVSIIHPRAEEPHRRTIRRESLAGTDVAIEFSRPDAAAGNILRLVETGCRSIVVGTTGWKDRLGEVERAVADAGAGLVHADNFSIGVSLFFRIVRHAAGLLLAGRAAGAYEPFILEGHHRGKKDAPSGTARGLAALLEEAAPELRRHEGGVDGGLPQRRFQVASVRAGSIPGRHTVGFEGEEDAIELTHAARGRAGFALGALLAAEWLPGRRGVFTLDEVLEDRT